MIIGLLSDTHSYIDDAIKEELKLCDEIWHAGDIGNPLVFETLEGIKPVFAVYGNIDGGKFREILPERLFIVRESVKIIMTHIGGYPGRYAPGIKAILQKHKPDLFISGHSHILKVMRDKELGLLHMNPGAAGQEGFHVMRTMLRFKIEKGKISDCNVIEFGKRGRI